MKSQEYKELKKKQNYIEDRLNILITHRLIQDDNLLKFMENTGKHMDTQDEITGEIIDKTKGFANIIDMVSMNMNIIEMFTISFFISMHYFRVKDLNDKELKKYVDNIINMMGDYERPGISKRLDMLCKTVGKEGAEEQREWCDKTLKFFLEKYRNILYVSFKDFIKKADDTEKKEW